MVVLTGVALFGMVSACLKEQPHVGDPLPAFEGRVGVISPPLAVGERVAIGLGSLRPKSRIRIRSASFEVLPKAVELVGIWAVDGDVPGAEIRIEIAKVEAFDQRPANAKRHPAGLVLEPGPLRWYLVAVLAGRRPGAHTVRGWVVKYVDEHSRPGVTVYPKEAELRVKS